MKRVTEIANFLRLLDESGLLSLTNLAVIVVIVKLALASQVDLSAAASLLTVLGSYHFKRYHNSKKPMELNKDEVSALRSEISRVKLALGFKNESPSK